MTTGTLLRVPRRAQDVAWVRSGDVIYLAVPTRIAPFQVVRLSQTGTSIWELIDGRRSLAEIASAIARDWGAEESEVSEAVGSFADTLIAQGALRPYPT